MRSASFGDEVPLRKMSEILRFFLTLPVDCYSGGNYHHGFRHNIMRCSDLKRATAKQEGNLDPFNMAMDDLFLRVVLPNLMLLGKWNVRGKDKVNNIIADVYISQILRYRKS